MKNKTSIQTNPKHTSRPSCLKFIHATLTNPINTFKQYLPKYSNFKSCWRLIISLDIICSFCFIFSQITASLLSQFHKKSILEIIQSPSSLLLESFFLNFFFFLLIIIFQATLYCFVANFFKTKSNFFRLTTIIAEYLTQIYLFSILLSSIIIKLIGAPGIFFSVSTFLFFIIRNNKILSMELDATNKPSSGYFILLTVILNFPLLFASSLFTFILCFV